MRILFYCNSRIIVLVNNKFLLLRHRSTDKHVLLAKWFCNNKIILVKLNFLVYNCILDFSKEISTHIFGEYHSCYIRGVKLWICNKNRKLFRHDNNPKVLISPSDENIITFSCKSILMECVLPNCLETTFTTFFIQGTNHLLEIF